MKYLVRMITPLEDNNFLKEIHTTYPSDHNIKTRASPLPLYPQKNHLPTYRNLIESCADYSQTPFVWTSECVRSSIKLPSSTNRPTTCGKEE